MELTSKTFPPDGPLVMPLGTWSAIPQHARGRATRSSAFPRIHTSTSLSLLAIAFVPSETKRTPNWPWRATSSFPVASS